MPAVVLGGGPSLRDQITRCPPRGEAIYLSANDHGARFTQCDYLVCHDKRDWQGNPMEETLRQFGAPIVSRHMFADYRIMGSIVPDTGIETAWVARLLGCAPIYICGIECYSGSGTYHHDPKAQSNGFKIPLTTHLGRWRETLRKYPGDYRPMGGPLKVHMPSWGVMRPGVPSRERLIADVSGVTVFALAEFEIRNRVFSPGRHYELPEREAGRVVKEGKARYV